MSGFFEDLIEKRQKFISGLDANKGDINLDIFEDFYPDQAHFLYELLQNAEDAEATEAKITLDKTGCIFEHNGKKLFSEDDVLSITGIHNSTKAKASDKIGKFGVGFKSVFVYTKTPSVYSGQFSFEIIGYVLPKLLDPMPDQDKKTIFNIPFNNPSKPQDESFREIKNGLDSIAETTLLFLPGISQIKWKVGTSSWSSVYRKKHSDNHYEVVKEVGGLVISRLHFLRFDSPVSELDKHVVSIAFPLDFLPKIDQFNPKSKLHKQLKIVPASPGTVAVFFPAEKETSNLRFHIHAPFVPELSRASIKETPVNDPLFKQLAELAASSLHKIKEYGLLNAEFLAALPNAQDQIPTRYNCILQSIIREMNDKPLTPTQSKKHAPANQLVQGKALLKDLLIDDDLAVLLEDEMDIVFWSASASQRNSNSDRFLNSLDINLFDVDEFVEIISSNSRHYNPASNFYSWLHGKGFEWHQKLYAFLFKELDDDANKFRNCHIILCEDGKYHAGDKCFFSGDDGLLVNSLPKVVFDVYAGGKSKSQQESASSFLDAVGVRPVDESVVVEDILKARYSKGNLRPNEKDLEMFVNLVDKFPAKSKIFSGYYILEIEGGGWSLPGSFYLDKPFIDSGLDEWYMSMKTTTKYKLNSKYHDCGIEKTKLNEFLVAVGATSTLRIYPVSCAKNPEWNSNLSLAPGSRYTDTGLDMDFDILGLYENLKNITLKKSFLIWSAMVEHKKQEVYLRARYQKNQSSNFRQADSLLVHRLRAEAWVPQGDDVFVKPSEASRELLPDGFEFDPGWAWIKTLKFGEDVIRKSEKHKEFKEQAKQYGINSDEDLDDARKFLSLPRESRDLLLSTIKRQADFELPEQQSNNPDRRSAKVAEQAVEAPEKKSELKTRSVSTGVDAIKEEASRYLQQQYTNEEVMICQICKDTLPFKLADGAYFFEKVEFLSDLENRHFQNYLALCPNHSAMFRLANNSKKTLLEDFMGISGNQMPILLAGTEVSVYFTKNHILDIKAVISAEKDGIDKAEDIVHFDNHEIPEANEVQVGEVEYGKKTVLSFFRVGDSVKILDGPFAGFKATVEEVMADKSQIKASVLIFSRLTPVILNFSQVVMV